MIRNRISAQNSRDRKKAYLRELEQNSSQISKENEQLLKQIQELSQLNIDIDQQNGQISQCIRVFKQQCLQSNDPFAQCIVKQLEELESDTDITKKVKL